jgi:thiol-disulfide isomerase/thioredoxin
MRNGILFVLLAALSGCFSSAGTSQVEAGPEQVLLDWQNGQPDPENLRSFFDYIAQRADSSQSLLYQSVYLGQVLNQEEGWESYSKVVDPGTVALLDYQLGKQNPYRDYYADALQHYYETRQLRYAHDFTAIDTNGQEVRLSQWDDKVLYIDTWASWCPPCMQQLPYLQQLARDYADEPDFLIVTVSFDRSQQAWLSALTRQESFSNILPLYVEGGMDSDYGALFSISSIPSYALLGRNRRVIDMSAPKPSVDSVRGMIGEALMQK